MTTSVFLGTPAAAVPALEATARVTDLRMVVTMPDRPRGRSGTPQPSPVKQAALDLGLRVEQPADRSELAVTLAGSAPVDVGVVVAFGMILRPEVLAIPRCGLVNLHFSLLPRWRGAAPVERAVLAGDSSTGATLMVVERGLDSGAVISQVTVPIGHDETSGSLIEELALHGAALLDSDLGRYVDGFLVAVPQDPANASYAPKIESSEARIAPGDEAEVILRLVRGFNPRPGAFAYHAGKRFKIWAARPVAGASLNPGEMVEDAGKLLLGVGDAVLELLEVQAEGSRRMTGGDWARGRREPLGLLT